MKFGVFDHNDDSGRPFGEQYEQRLQLVEIYERLGFHAYHLAEHHATALGAAPDPGVFLGAVAQRTRRLKFGPLVYVLPLHHPVRLLEQIGMLDQMSGGRFQLGIGRGGGFLEPARFGIKQDDIAPMFEEVLEILLRGLAGDTLDYEGRYYTLKDVPMLIKPVQRPHPPLWYGTATLDKTVWAAKNNVNLLSLQPYGKTHEIATRFRAEWQALGKDPDAMPFMGLSRHAFVADTDEAARRIAGRAWKRWVESYSWLYRRSGMTSTKLPVSDDLDAMIQSGFVFAGSPESMRQWVRRVEDEAGVNYLVLELVFGDMTMDEAKRCIELFGREVIPAFDPTASC